jgi:hypothetical protein
METTALGAAYFAGFQAGICPDFKNFGRSGGWTAGSCPR